MQTDDSNEDSVGLSRFGSGNLFVDLGVSFMIFSALILLLVLITLAVIKLSKTHC